MGRVTLAVRSRIYREGLVAALGARSDLTIAAEAVDAAGAIEVTARCQPDAVLLDADLGEASVLVAQLRHVAPSTRIVVLGLRSEGNDELLRWAEAGAVGFVSCDQSLDDMVNCLRSALAGDLACTPRVAALLLQRMAQLAAASAAPQGPAAALSPRQAHVLQLVRAGRSNKQIARELGIELATVKNHVHQVLQRLNVRGRHEAAACLAPSRH